MMEDASPFPGGSLSLVAMQKFRRGNTGDQVEAVKLFHMCAIDNHSSI